MTIDPTFAAIIVIAAVAALAVVGRALSERAARQEQQRREQAEAEARRQAEEERRRLEEDREKEKARRAEEAGLAAARERKACADAEAERARESFRETHDRLIAGIRRHAKEGCDAEFQQRFGVTRPPKAPTPEEDHEVQFYLREHYARLRDAAVAELAESFIQDEVERRMGALAAAREEPDGGDRPEAIQADAGDGRGATPESDAAETGTRVAESGTDEAASGADEAGTGEGTADGPGPDGGPDGNGDEEATDGGGGGGVQEGADVGEGDRDESGEQGPVSGEPAADDGKAPADDGPTREEVEAAVREDFDADSARTYMLAAISARFTPAGKPLGELPWPAYTAISPLGYGELSLVEGAPVYAQDAYRDFAWKKFHLGKRAEKPTRGEYSWPQSHELGDVDAEAEVETPAGTFTVSALEGPLPLREMRRCAWVRHDLEYHGALLVPDRQRCLLVNLEGLRKGTRLELRFAHDGDFLQEVDDGDFTLNAVGQAGEAFVGISVSDPGAASPGEAPYELVERDGTGFIFQLTSDARRHDDDTYPQFMQVNLAWCQPPSPKPERIVRHVTK